MEQGGLLGSQKQLKQPRCSRAWMQVTGPWRTHPATHSPTRPAPQVQCQGATSREEGGGGVAGRPGVTGSDGGRAGDASGTAEVGKSQTPSTCPSLGSPAPSPGRPHSCGAREVRRGAGAELPLGCPPRPGAGPRTRPPFGPGFGSCQARSDLPEDSGGARGQERSILRPPAGLLVSSFEPSPVTPSPDITHHREGHAHVRPSHHPRSVD